MHKNQQVISLIRKFQHVFATLEHDQIIERLLKLVMAQSSLSRCALLFQADNQLWLEAIATRESVQHVAESLDGPYEDGSLCSYDLPLKLIQTVFQTSTSVELDSREKVKAATEGGADTGIDHTTLVLQPIGIEPVAVFCCESRLGLLELRRELQSLQSIWQFSELMLVQIGHSRSQGESGTQQQTSPQQLSLYETYFDAVLKYSPGIISVKNLDGEIILASESCHQLLGSGDAGVIGINALDVFDKESRRLIVEADNKAKKAEGKVELQVDLKHNDGEVHTYWMTKFALLDPADEVIGVCTTCTDISDRIAAEARLREQETRLNFMAFHDELTELPNRALFYDRFDHSLARAKRSGNQVVLMLLDLDRFKHINDSLSHDAGDLLLKIVSKRLQENVRDMDTVARLGGDEFVVVLEGIQADDDIALVANKILLGTATPVTIMGHEISTSVSIGISVYPLDGETTDTLLQHAEVAMYKSKASGKNCFKFFTEDMNASAVSYLLLENELRRAIENDQLVLHYQPQFNLSNGEIVGMEALVRWRHPERGVISPFHFISVAEESGLIVDLGNWVLRKACQQIKKWINEGKYFGTIAVNLSPRQFAERNFTDALAQVLSETALPPQHLELEITESCAMEHASQTITMMKEINAMGVSLSIDDFGTGYSSLAYLREFPIQKLKIDRSFVNDITTDSNDAAIAQSIISLAHNMSLKVVAEGVEFEEQACWLRERGCDMVQGYHFAVPMPAEQLNERLHQGKFVAAANVVQIGSEKPAQKGSILAMDGVSQQKPN